MSDTNYDEANDYDLGSSGTIVETSVRDHAIVGATVEMTTAVELKFEIKGNATDWIEIDSHAAGDGTVATFGQYAPEARQVRVRNTGTASNETADALLGGSGT